MAFLNTLNKEELQKTQFAFGDMARFEWHYVPTSMFARKGIAVKDLSGKQKKQVDELLHAFLSREGFYKTKFIMGLEDVLHTMEPLNESRIPGNYMVAIFGTPDKDSIWGWRFSGHHVTLNFTVVDDTIAFAPFFFGANPAIIPNTPADAYRPMRQEESIGFDLVHSLTPAQLEKANFAVNAYEEILSTNVAEVSPMKPEGIAASEMTNDQKLILNRLIVTYLSAMPKALAELRMKKIIAEDINTIWFGWAGETVPGKAHYYRIQGKSFLVEFDNTQSHANHIHTVWRDFNGDFGRDLLKEHYQQVHHHDHDH